MKTRLFTTALLVVILTALVACATPTTAPTSAPAATAAPAAPVATTAPAAPVATTASAAPAATTAAMPFGLKPGKPYNGTKLKYLICCNTAQQFFSLAQKTSEFTALTGIEVEWGNTPFAQFQQTLMTEGTSGSDTYDLLAWVDSWGYALQSFVLPLDSRIQEAKIDLSDYPPAYLNPAKTADGKVLGLPLRGHAYMLFYRKDVFDKLGLKAPETYADVEAAAKVIAEKTTLKPISPYFNAGTGGQNMFTWLSLLWGNGGDIFDKDWKPTFNNEAGVQATQRYVDWLQKYKYAADASKTWGEGDAATDFQKGNSAMWLGWSWYYANFSNPKVAAPEVASGVAFVPAPSWEGKGKPATYGYIWETGIFKSSKKQDAAWEYLKWLSSAQTDKKVALDKSDPKLDNVVVVHFSTLNDPEVNAKNGNLQKTMALSLQNARTQPLMNDWLAVQTLLETAINQMANGAPVKATLDKTAADVTDTLKKAGGYYK
jgi:multiple sugar transport system substrate-binding protein